jgi:hypothetical protein
MIYGSRSALEVLSDSAELVYKLSGMADGFISLVGFFESRGKFIGNAGAAVFAEITVGARVFF